MTGPDTEPRWGLPDALICFLASVFSATVALTVWQGVSGETTRTLGAVFAGLVGTWLGLVGGMVIVTRQKGSGSLVADFALRFVPRTDLIGIPLGIGFQILVIPLLYLPITRLITDLDERLEEPARELTDIAHGGGVVLLAILVVIGAPIVEELFYRGLLLRALERRAGPRVAIVGSAALFAAGHLEPLQFPALFAFGILLAWLAVRYQRLGPGIFAHAAFNAITVAVLIAQR